MTPPAYRIEWGAPDPVHERVFLESGSATIPPIKARAEVGVTEATAGRSPRRLEVGGAAAQAAYVLSPSGFSLEIMVLPLLNVLRGVNRE
jgi:hypothetical protein